jgi:hypothetical protein
MIAVPTREEFESLISRVCAMEKDLSHFKAMSLKNKWLSRTQTLDILQVSESTLCRLTKQGFFIFRKERRKIQYESNSIRAYLEKHLLPEAVTERFIKSSQLN